MSVPAFDVAEFRRICASGKNPDFGRWTGDPCDFHCLTAWSGMAGDYPMRTGYLLGFRVHPMDLDGMIWRGWMEREEVETGIFTRMRLPRWRLKPEHKDTAIAWLKGLKP